MNQALPAGISASTSLVTELELGSARGTHIRTKPDLDIEIVRALCVEDLPAIQSPPPVTAGAQLVKTLRHSHHRLAELIASGRPQQEIALITGYSPSYISTMLSGDPAFVELVAYYEFQANAIFVDSMERLKLLGLDAMERLHERVNDPAVTFSNEELRKLVDMAAVQPAIAKHIPVAGNAQSASLNLEVKFVGASAKDSPVVDVKYTDVTPK